jgi:hypothetical protein
VVRINPATAAKAFSGLVEEGILYKRRGLGMFVAPGARQKLLADHRKCYFEDVRAPVLQQADILGIPTDEIVADVLGAKGERASDLGALIYFPSLMFSGVWVPLDVMPDWMREIGLYLPLGGAAQGLTTGWFGNEGFPPAQVLVLAAWTLVLFPLGVKLFRWE